MTSRAIEHLIRRTCALLAVLCLAAACQAADKPAFLKKPSPQHVRIMCYNVNWDAIFPDDDPQNHRHRRENKRAEFVRIVRAIQPDIVCIQEINSRRDPQQVAKILDQAVPLPDGRKWRAHRGNDNVIAARYDLKLRAKDTKPPTRREQAMALIDLPDKDYACDLYMINAHFKAAGGESNIKRRQQHADAIVNWIRDIRTSGGHIDLPAKTPIVILGDLNVYDTDPHYHLTTLLTGDIKDEKTYGPDIAPDWDNTPLTDALPLHNGVGPERYTWRNDRGQFKPGPLDHIIYTDSVISVGNSFVLNTAKMTKEHLAVTGLEAADVAMDLPAGVYDHLPLVADFLDPRATPKKRNED